MTTRRVDTAAGHSTFIGHALKVVGALLAGIVIVVAARAERPEQGYMILSHLDPQMWIFFGLLLASGTMALVNAKHTRADRSYHPMLIILWLILTMYSAGIAGAVLAGSATYWTIRIGAALFLLGGFVYAHFFIRKRNATPRFIFVRASGVAETPDYAHLRQSWIESMSLIAHNAMPEEWLGELAQAMEQGMRHAEWKNDLPERTSRYVAARRAARKGDET